MDNENYKRVETASSAGALDWQKDGPEGKKDFDFDAFLADDLEERITAALDGRDLLEPDAFGQSVSGYVPRRASDGERGRHEAPEPVSTAQTPHSEEERIHTPSRPDPNDPRYAAPERPHVVVAEPRSTVYITPPASDDYETQPEPRAERTHRGLITAVVVLAIVAALVGLLLAFLSSGANDRDTSDAPRPTSQTSQTREDTFTPSPKPEETPAQATPTAPPAAATYRITVTVGSGGSVSPRGVVAVTEGEDVTFSITPDSGYVLSQLLIDGSAVDLTESYRFSGVTKDHTIYAVFQAAATPTPEPTATPEPSSTPEQTLPPTEPPEAEETVPDAPPEELPVEGGSDNE